MCFTPKIWTKKMTGAERSKEQANCWHKVLSRQIAWWNEKCYPLLSLFIWWFKGQGGLSISHTAKVDGKKKSHSSMTHLYLWYLRQSKERKCVSAHTLPTFSALLSRVNLQCLSYLGRWVKAGRASSGTTHTRPSPLHRFILHCSFITSGRPGRGWR